YGTTHVVRFGDASKPALVFLHGKTESATMWIDLAPAFAATHHVHLIDTIGDMNKSVATKMAVKQTDVVAWLDATFDTLHVERTALIGHSIGAWIATTYAMARPARVSHLALLSPAAVFSRVRFGWIARAIATHMIRPSRAKARKFTDTMLVPATIAKL